MLLSGVILACSFGLGQLSCNIIGLFYSCIFFFVISIAKWSAWVYLSVFTGVHGEHTEVFFWIRFFYISHLVQSDFILCFVQSLTTHIII